MYVTTLLRIMLPLGYDDNASLDIVKVDTEEASATSTEQIMETVEVNKLTPDHYT